MGSAFGYPVSMLPSPISFAVATIACNIVAVRRLARLTRYDVGIASITEFFNTTDQSERLARTSLRTEGSKEKN
jgi:hypothetical protein